MLQMLDSFSTFCCWILGILCVLYVVWHSVAAPAARNGLPRQSGSRGAAGRPSLDAWPRRR